MPALVPEGFGKSAYLSLTTFRRGGRPVATPVWFALNGDRIVVWSGAQEGKVKRLRNNSRVTVAVCDHKGKLKGPLVEATPPCYRRMPTRGCIGC